MIRATSNLTSFILSASILALPWLFGGALSGTQSAVCWTVAGLLGATLLLAYFGWLSGGPREWDFTASKLTADGRGGSQVGAGDSSMFVGDRRWCPHGWGLCCLLMVGVLLGCFQLLPLSRAVTPWLASGAAAWRELQLGDEAARWTAVAGDLDRSSALVVAWDGQRRVDSIHEANRLAARTRSLYPPDTRKGLALLFLGAAVLWLSMMLARPQRIRWILVAVTTNGVLISLCTIVRKVRGVERQVLIDQISATGISLGPFGGLGPFVNRNNEGGYLCLCLAAAIGLLALSSLERPAGPSSAASGDRRSAGRVAVIAAIVFLCAGILATGSRGASLALAISLVVTLVVAWRTNSTDIVASESDAGSPANRYRVAGWRMSQLQIAGVGVAVVTLTAALLGWLGAGDETSQRWRQTLDERVAEMRITNWREAIGSSREFAGWGSGLMTYRFVSLPLQDRPNVNWFRYAENQFVQAYVDAGVVGLLVLTGCLAIFIRVTWKLLRGAPRSQAWASSMGLMGVFLVVSQVVSGSFDFGWYVPANLCLMAALVGVVLAAFERSEQPDRSSTALPNASSTASMVKIGMGCLLGMPLAVGGFELRNADRIERLTSNQFVNALADNKSADSIDSWIAALTEAINRRWDDGEAHHQLSQLYLQRYRIAMFDELRLRQPWLSEQRHWRESSFAFQLRSLRDKEGAQQVRYRELAATSGYLNKAFEHCELARVHCPWLPEPHLWSALTAYLRGSVSVEDVNAAVARATRFGRGRPSTWYWAGVLQSLVGDEAKAYAAWQRCVSFSTEFDSAILPWLNLSSVASDAARLDAAISALGEKLFVELMVRDSVVAERWVRMLGRADTDQAKALRSQLLELALESDLRGTGVTPERWASRARLFSIAGRTTESLAAWQACVAEKTHPPFCEQYARALISAGQLEAAKVQFEKWEASGLDRRTLKTIQRELEAATGLGTR